MLGLAAGTALDALGDGAVDVVVRDPALVVVLIGARGRAGRLRSREGLGNFNLLRLLARPGDTCLGEQRLDPCRVDEVGGSAEDTGQEEV